MALSTGGRETWAWNLDDLLDDVDRSSDEENVEGLRKWTDRNFATDVFVKGSRPPIGSVLIGFSAEPELHIVSLALVEALAGVSTGKVRATLGSFLHLPEGTLYVAPKSLAEALSARSLRPTPVHPSVAEDILARLKQLVPAVETWLGQISRKPVRIGGDSGLRLSEERDAIQMAIALSGLDLEASPFATHADASDEARATELLNADLFEDNEDDLLFADLRRFDTGGDLAEVSASTSRYVHGEFELLIANVNRKPIEHSLGVDLLYWDRSEDSFTLIQYKRLVKEGVSLTSGAKHWVYKRQSELQAQIEKMSSVVVSSAISREQWRIVGNPFWFKFVQTDAFDPQSKKVLKGIYVASEYIALGLKRGWFSSGPKGGFSLGYGNTKYLSRTPFIELVRRGLSGSAGATSSEIMRIVKELSPASDLLVVRKSNLAKTKVI